MITLNSFLEGIRANCSRITHYELGGDGTGGGCDCIGLIIGAVRLAGGNWTGTHGSNYAARNEMESFGVVREWYLGEVVYKAREPGDAKYALPDRYKASGDLLDYYHVGVVTSVSPLIITHCTSVPGGIKEDNQPGAWKYGGKLKCVNYGGDVVDVLYEAQVVAVSGRTVNLRAKPTEQSTVLKSVPVGSTVEVLDDTDPNWTKIRYLYYDGWMMSKFLVPIEQEDLQNELREIRDELAKVLARLEKLVMGGVG